MPVALEIVVSAPIRLRASSVGHQAAEEREARGEAAGDLVVAEVMLGLAAENARLVRKLAKEQVQKRAIQVHCRVDWCSLIPLFCLPVLHQL